MNKVVIIEDNPFILKSFEETISKSEGFEVIGAFISCEEALKTLEEKPDIFIIDLKLPGMSGIEGINVFRNKYPKAKNIVISVLQDSEHIFKALSAGAIGYLKKNTNPSRLIEALDQVIHGGSPMSSTIARKIVAYFQVPNHELLSKRENDVLKILAKGNSYASIAEQLHVSINTIKSHTRSIYEKLEINSRDELIKKIQNGITEDPFL